ncbi:hypothetical protein AXE77_05220 [Gardnerella vaginalis]|uniref:DUF948 domain-containing protein n=1 Tax=Gardnerella vaginalis TaxID=2702 RepID=A0A3E1IZD4_GARVA|nr:MULTISPECIES: DUF948 domain-containing protein [Gardnerella]RFD78386.1 hypothetical protein AXE77_05220 [Gardnerella vaginalis]
MSVGDIAALIAAISFAVLSGFLIYPLFRLGRLFDQIAETVRKSGEHALPAIDESVTTIKQVNKTLEDVNAVSDATRTTVTNIGALTDLYGAFLGKPIVKIAAAGYALKDTLASFFNKPTVPTDASSVGRHAAKESYDNSASKEA